MWSLNDESGGIGWDAPEAMSEIIASHEGLAKEYTNVLISYVREDGNFLEYEPLQRGAVWGIGSVAQARPDLVQDALPHGKFILLHLKSRQGCMSFLSFASSREPIGHCESALAFSVRRYVRLWI